MSTRLNSYLRILNTVGADGERYLLHQIVQDAGNDGIQ
jgi:hypothetical protein